MPIRSLPLALALLALPLAACGSGSGGGTAGSSQTSVCANDPRAQTYVAGMTAASTDGALTVTLVGADPAPPARGLNTWTVKITDTSGASVTSADISLAPFMPDHGHGPSVVPTVTSMPTQGTYEIDQIDLFMPGIWANTFTVTPASGAPETAVFTFCVDG